MANYISAIVKYSKRPMIGFEMKFIILFCVLVLVGCSTIKEAKNEFDYEIKGFKKEWARVILKKEVEEQ